MNCIYTSNGYIRRLEVYLIPAEAMLKKQKAPQRDIPKLRILRKNDTTHFRLFRLASGSLFAALPNGKTRCKATFAPLLLSRPTKKQKDVFHNEATSQ